MTTPLLPGTGWPRWARYLAGMILGNLATAILYAVLTGLVAGFTFYFKDFGPKADSLGAVFAMSLGIPSLFLIPLFGGLTASYVWRGLNLKIGATILASLLTSLLGLTGAAIFLKEGVICLVIVSPLYFVTILCGALIGRNLFRADRTRLHLTIFPLLFLLAGVEMATRENQTGVVTDKVLIKAPPEQVWALVTSFPKIPNPPRFWLFRLGLPYPMSTTSDGNFVGANRACIFSSDAVFDEVVSDIEPGKMLTFEIVKLPPDPELIGHLTPLRGRFTLRDNGDGTTSLIGDTWYTLHVRPLGYFDWWTQHIFRAVHLRVMEDIRRRAEEAS